MNSEIQAMKGEIWRRIGRTFERLEELNEARWDAYLLKLHLTPTWPPIEPEGKTITFRRPTPYFQ